MRRRWSAVAFLGLALLAACTFTRRGVFVKLPEGTEGAMKVAVGETTTEVEGTDPASGERFKGTLSTEGEGGSRRGMAGPPPAVGGGSVTPGVAPMPVQTGPGTIVMSGRLVGNKGTVLRCVVQIKRTLRLEGTGTCRVLDAQDAEPAYRIRF